MQKQCREIPSGVSAERRWHPSGGIGFAERRLHPHFHQRDKKGSWFLCAFVPGTLFDVDEGMLSVPLQKGEKGNSQCLGPGQSRLQFRSTLVAWIRSPVLTYSTPSDALVGSRSIWGRPGVARYDNG
jgi:hypothetical protein